MQLEKVVKIVLQFQNVFNKYTMKKVIIAFAIILISFIIWQFESRQFFNLKNGNISLTLWKNPYNKTNYIIIGKYYGIYLPENYISSQSNREINLFFSNKNTKNIIVTGGGDIKIINRNKESIIITRYTNQDSINNIFRDSLNSLSIDFKENYVIDENGEFLK
jgi:hypothetical protein